MLQTLNNKDEHYLKRKGMVQGLGYLLKPENQKEIRELAKALKDSSSVVKKETVISLGKIKPKGEKEIEQELIKIAKNQNEEDFLRKAAINTLGEIIKPESSQEIWEIYELLIDPDFNIREAASSALRKIDSNIYEIVQSVDIQELYQKHIKRRENKEFFNSPPPKPFESWFEVRIFLAIHKKGYFVIPQFEFAANKTIHKRSGQKPYRIDLVIIGSGGKKLAVECDGSQHESDNIKQVDVKRQKKLESFGLRFWRISEKNFYSQPDQTLERLWEKLDEEGIQPFSESKRRKFFLWRKKKK